MLPLMVIHQTANVRCQRCFFVQYKYSSHGAYSFCHIGQQPQAMTHRMIFDQRFLSTSANKYSHLLLLKNRTISSIQSKLDDSTLKKSYHKTTLFSNHIYHNTDNSTITTTTTGGNIPKPSNQHHNDEIPTMGIFRLLNDAQRTLLFEQRQLTERVVRKTMF
jgi:hypothetical protein